MAMLQVNENTRDKTHGTRLRSIISVVQSTIWLFLAIFANHSQAMNKDFLSDNNYHTFTNIQLPPDANSINTLFQDEQGLTWIGTKKGVYYYDGYNIHKLVTEEEAASYNVTAILQLEHYLCIGTNQGLLLFNLLTEQYETLFPGMETIKAVTALILFNRKLWIGTQDGTICHYDFDRHTLCELSPEKKEARRIIHVFEATNDKLYVGSYIGLSVYDLANDTFKDIPFPSSKDQAMVTSLLWDKEKNCIWVGTETNLFCHSKTTDYMDAFPLPVATPIESLESDGRSNLLLGTINGLYIYNKTDRKVSHYTHSSGNNRSLCNSLVRCCYIDKNNNTWLGTGNGISLAQYNPIYKMTHISELTDNNSGNQFCAIYKDSQGNYWFGGKNGLILNTSNGETRWYHTGSKTYPLKHNQIWQIYEDSSNDIWIVTDRGIARYDSENQQFVFYTVIDKTGKRSARWAYNILEDCKGRLWIATYIGGLFVVDKAKLLKQGAATEYIAEQNFSGETSFTDNVYQLISDKNNNIWANTDYGLIKIDIKTETFTQIDCHPAKMIYDGNEYIWFCNYNSLYRFNLTTHKSEHLYALANSEGQIYSFAMAENLLGFSSTEGITYMDRNTLAIKHFNLPQNNYETGLYDAERNQVTWGGNDILISFPLYALHQKEKKSPAPIRIMGVYVDNKKLVPGKSYKGVSVRHQDHITLDYSQRNIGIEIADLTYTAEYSNIYYRLNNQENWNKLPSAQNMVTFANLPPGKYVLDIRSGNSPDSALSSHTRFLIQILPPWYASATAYALYSLAVGVLLFFAVKNIRLRLKRKYEEVERDLDLSNMKIDFFLHISRELKTPLNLIITPTANLLEETRNEGQRYRLELIYKNALRLNTLIRRVLDIKQMDYEEENKVNKSQVELCALTKSMLECFASSFKEKEIQVSFTCTPEQIWLEADTLKLESVLLTLLSDIGKHADQHGGILELSLSRHGNEVNLQFLDKGSGLLERGYTSGLARLFSHNSKRRKNKRMNGLYIIKKYIELHGGSIKVLCNNRKRDGNGENSIHITLPVANECACILPIKKTASPVATGNENAPILLIVCDNTEELSFLTSTFTYDYTCLTALNGKDGLEIARQQLPDLILIDLSETGTMNSIKYAKQLKHYQPTAPIPLLMLAIDSDKESEQKSIETGIDIFMPKPFDVGNLKLRLQQLLQARRSLEKKIRVEHLTQPTETKVVDRDSDEIFLSRITVLIEEQLENTEFGVSMLSELSKTDKKRLYRRLKQITGFTPVEYIRQIRMKKAAMLLSQKKLSISEVMYKVGFSNASYFSKCFMAEFKMTPTQYMAESH